MTGCITADELEQIDRGPIMSPSIATRENRQFASELKFNVSSQVAAQIREWARNYLAPDRYGSGPARDQYRITSIYFDTESFDVFHRNGSFGRGKYRIRRYGASEVVFLERKLRTKDCLTKRRTCIPASRLNLLESCCAQEDWPGRWFARRLAARQINPVCQVSYDRIARVAMTPFGPIRITVDEGLRAARACSVCFNSDAGAPVLPGQAIVEMKFMLAMPTLFKRLAEEFALSPARFSKYRFSAQALGLATEQNLFQ